MDEQESVARALADRLVAAGIRARAEGAGVHWHVDIESATSRALLVHCFWYDRAVSGLVLGVNPANSRSRLSAARRAPYEGPEYLVILRDGEARIADGRTRTVAEVLACAQAWLAGFDLDRLVGDVPFVDERPRKLRALAAGLPPQLRWDIGDEPGCELWVYGEGRSCMVVVSTVEGFDCSFLLGQAQVALGASLEDVPGAVAAWLVARLSVQALATSAAGVELERHAEVVETDPARWHWLHLLDRIADPDDVLARQRELVEALASSPVATSFFSYSSMGWLCFSASSHYPWVDDGLPAVVRARDGYLVANRRQEKRTPCNLRRAVQLIERELESSAVRPFFGSEPHHEASLVSASLARQQSTLRPQVIQRGPWYELVVGDPARGRRCTMSGTGVSFDGASESHASWPTLDEACRAVILYCERGASLEEVLRSAATAQRRP